MDAVGNAIQAPEYQGGAQGSQDAVAGLLNSPEYQAPVTTPEQLSDQGANEGGQFGKGLRSSTIKLGSDLNALAGQAGETMGLTAFAQNRFAQAKHMAVRADAASPDVRDPQGIHDLASATDYVEGVMGGAAASMALPVAAGVLLKNPALGMAVGMGPQMVGSEVQRLRADPKVMATKTPGQILENAALTGGAETALYSLPIGGAAGIAEKLLSPTERAASLAAETLKTGAVMGAQGAGVEAISQAGHTYANPERDKSHDTQDLINAGVSTGIAGLGLGAATHLATGGRAAIDEAMKKPDVATVKQIFEPKSGPKEDHEYPDNLKTPEEVGNWLDENTAATDAYLKAAPEVDQFKGWESDPEVKAEFVKTVKQKLVDAVAKPKVDAIFNEADKYLDDHKETPGVTNSLMRTRVDDNILDHAMEKVPEDLASVMTASHKMKLVDMLKTAVQTGDVPEGIIHLYNDPAVAKSVVMNTASLMKAEPAKIASAFASTAKQVEERNNSVEDLVRNNMRPELYTNREMRDTIMKNYVPELQDYASMGAQDEKAAVAKMHAAFGDKDEIVAAGLDKIRQQTTSTRANESAAKPGLDQQEEAPDTASPIELGKGQENTDSPAFYGDARLNRTYSSLEDVNRTIDDLKSEYGRRANFQALTDRPGEFHIAAHDAVGDETGFDQGTWSRLWNAESRKQNKSGPENGVLTINRQPIDPATERPRVKADGSPVYTPLKSSTMSLVMEMGSRYGRTGSDLKGANRVGDLFFRGISQILSDPTVNKDKPFTQIKSGDGKAMSFPDNMRIGKFEGKEYTWKDIKHYVMSHEDMSGVSDEMVKAYTRGGDQAHAEKAAKRSVAMMGIKEGDGRYDAQMMKQTKKFMDGIPQREALHNAHMDVKAADEAATTGVDTPGEFHGKQKQGPEFQNAGDNLAVEEADRFKRARQASGGEEQGFDVKPAEAGKTRSGKLLKADSSPDLTERTRPGPTIREQDDYNRGGKKGRRDFAEFTGEELHPPESAGSLEVTKAELAYKKEIANRVVKNLNNGHVDTMIERAKAATDVRALYHTLDTLHEMVPFTERNHFWKTHEGLPDGAKETDNLRQAAKKLEAAVAAKVKELGPRPTETRAQEATRLKLEAAQKEAPVTNVDPGTSRDNAMDTRELRHVSPTKHEGKFDWRTHGGKGEGHSAKGAGTYLLSDEGVHRYYKKQFSDGMRLGDSGVSGYGAEELLQILKPGKITPEEAARAHAMLEQRAEALSERLDRTGDTDVEEALYATREGIDALSKVMDKGETVDFKDGETAPTYHIRLHADDTELMDWNKPMSEQSDLVQKATKPLIEEAAMHDVKSMFNGVDDVASMRIGGTEYRIRQIAKGQYEFRDWTGKDEVIPKAQFLDAWAKTRTGGDLYEALVDKAGGGYKAKAATSERLQEAGLVGHVFDAEGGKNNENRNYVIYNDSKLENTHVSFSDMKVDPNKPLDPETEKTIRDYVGKVLGPKAKVLFEAMDKAGNFAKLSGVETLRISIHALDPHGIGFHEAAHALFARLGASDPKSKALLEHIANSPTIMTQLRELLKDHPNALKQLDNSEERVAYMYQFWAGDALKMGPKATTFFGRIKNFFRQILATTAGTFDGPEDMARAENILTAFHSGDLAEPSTVREVLATKNRASIMERATNMLGPIAKGAGKLTFTADGVIADMKQPALDRMREMMHNIGIDAEGKARGFLGTKGDLTSMYANNWTRAVKGATAADFRMALEHGQNGTRPTGGVVKQVYDANRKLLNDLYDYQVKAGVKRRTGLVDGKPTYEDIGFLKDYFPRVYDQQYVESHREDFEAMLKKNGVSDTSAVYSHIMHDVDSIKPGTDEMDSSIMYFNPHTGKRTLIHIPDSDLAPFQSKDLGNTMMNYISRAVKRAEYTRRFGNSGELIQDAVAEAKKNGLSEEDAKTFNKAMETMSGSIRVDMNRDLRKIMGGIATYENIRLLPLSLMSNLVDPWGIMVRGGTLNEVIRTYKNSLTSIWKANKSEGYDLAASIGAISDAVNNEYMSEEFGHQFISPKAKALNDWFFKWNGMEGWNRQTRAGAAAAAEHFLIKHAMEPTTHSARYLRELNLTPEDIKNAMVKEPNQEGKLVDHLSVDDSKIRDALNSWIDGAIVRPNAAIRPVWMSDPLWLLAAQYKQYTYGVQKILMARVAHEAKNGNVTPAIAMASMVPTMIAADMARAAFTPSSVASSNKEAWGWLDWIESGIQRVGLTGFGQYGLEMGKNANSAGYVLGPAVNQAMNAVHTSLGTTLRNAVPGGNLFNKPAGGAPLVPTGG